MIFVQSTHRLMLALACLALSCAASSLAAAPETPASADAQRQQDVREKGSLVMPFSLEQTHHTFEKNDTGGVQRVRASNADADQVAMIRSHLHSIEKAFSARDFSAPAHIHGAAMPGMAEMEAAAPGELTVSYHDLDDGAELDYVSRAPATIAAIHQWFDAQLADHGRDATSR